MRLATLNNTRAYFSIARTMSLAPLKMHDCQRLNLFRSCRRHLRRRKACPDKFTNYHAKRVLDVKRVLRKYIFLWKKKTRENISLRKRAICCDKLIVNDLISRVVCQLWKSVTREFYLEVLHTCRVIRYRVKFKYEYDNFKKKL